MKVRSGFDAHLEHVLSGDPALRRSYAKQLAKLPVTAQLAVMRRRKWLTQKALARSMRGKQPHVARVERSSHDPRLSSVVSQARALRCRLVVVPDGLLTDVALLVASSERRLAAHRHTR